MKKLYLVGGGGHCQSCIDVIESGGEYAIQGIFDVSAHLGKKIFDYPVIGTDQEISSHISSDVWFLITIGQIKNSELREKLFYFVQEKGGQLATVISPRAYISKRAQIGAGTIVMHDALVNAGAVIGKNCILNTKALVEHGSVVGAHSHIATGAIINGDVEIGDGCFIGSHATVKQSMKLAERTFINAGVFYNGK